LLILNLYLQPGWRDCPQS